MKKFMRISTFVARQQVGTLFLFFLLYFLTMLTFVFGLGQANYLAHSLNYYNQLAIKEADYVFLSFSAVQHEAVIEDLQSRSYIRNLIYEIDNMSLDLRPAGDISELNTALIPGDSLAYFVQGTAPKIATLPVPPDSLTFYTIVPADSSFKVGTTRAAKISGMEVNLIALAEQRRNQLFWDFGNGGSAVSWDQLLAGEEKMYIINQGQLADLGQSVAPTLGMLIIYDPDATQTEKNDLHDYLRRIGVVSIYSDDMVTAQTKTSLTTKLKLQLPLPLTLAVSAIILCISLAIMRIFRLEKTIAVYELIGLSRRDSILAMNIWPTVLMLASLGTVSLLVLVAETSRPDFLYRGNQVLINGSMFFYLLLFILFSLLLSIGITAYLLRKTTLVEKLGRRE